MFSVNNRVPFQIFPFSQAVKNVLSMSEKEISKQNNVEKFEIREQNKNKTEAKWKYKVRSFQPSSFKTNGCLLQAKVNSITIC